MSEVQLEFIETKLVYLEDTVEELTKSSTHSNKESTISRLSSIPW